MKYPYVCTNGDADFEISAPIQEGPPEEVLCPVCGEAAQRIYTVAKEIWNTEGSSADYFKESKGRGQPMEKKEWLNYNWSRKTGKPPPPPDSVGTYDGIPRKGQVIKKKTA